MKPLDRIIIGLSLLLSLCSFFLVSRAYSEPAVEVKIYASRDLRATYPLAVSKKNLKVEGALGPSEFEISDGRVRMTNSPCPHQDCVRQGWQKNQGSRIICLPNRIIIEITGDDSPDAVNR